MTKQKLLLRLAMATFVISSAYSFFVYVNGSRREKAMRSHGEDSSVIQIKVATYRYYLDKLRENKNASNEQVFLDEADVVISKLRSFGYPVSGAASVSVDSGVVKDKTKDLFGALVGVTVVSRTGLIALAKLKWYRGDMSSGEISFSLEKYGSEWKVTSEESLWVS